MKKILKSAMAVAAACMAAVLMAVTAFAEVKDVEPSVVRAKMSPAWGQSITYTGAEFGITNITEDTEILVEYETEEGAMPDNGHHPVELILQNYAADPQIWAQISPTEFDETSAKFTYADIAAIYVDFGGLEDFSDVNNVCFGATMVGAKVTKVTITNVEEAEVTTTTTAATTEAVTEPETEAATEATTAATTSAPAAEKESSGGIPIVLIVVITVVVAVIAVVIILVLKGRKRFY